MKISLIFNLNRAEPIDVSFESLQATIINNEWSPSTFKGTRRKSNFLQTELMVLDVDSGPTIEEAKIKFQKYKYIIAPTRNHQKEKNGTICDRYRVILFLQVPITNNNIYDATWRSIYKKFNFIDKACKDSSRFFYPSTSVYAVNLGDTVSIVDASEPQYDNKIYNHKGLLPITYKYLQACGVPEGQRNHIVFRVSCDLYRFGYSFAEVYELMSKVTDLPDWEVKNTVRSAANAVLKQDI